MKKLIVSLKTSSEVLDNFKNALKNKQFYNKEHNFEISFDNKNDFSRFIRNIDVLTYIINFKPTSIYELAKLIKRDVSNLSKIINFFNELGVIKIEKNKFSGRYTSRPLVEYNIIQFKLAA
ncbi:hypothetical protein HY745_06885 [Candidatus Desantisbacteria bacterium]|nr:hypothetical protein [Candidatus Desantisbacteria bacterium]